MEEELNIQFIDIEQREVDARQQLRSDMDKLEARRKKNGGLGAYDASELERLKGLREALENDAKVDPLFAVVRWSFASDNGDVRPVRFDHKNGKIGLAESTATGTSAVAQLVRIALTIGFVQAAEVKLPQIRGSEKDGVWPIRDHENFSDYSEAFFSAIGRVSGNFDLARAVLPILAEQGDLKHDNREPVVSTLEFAKVVNKLISRGVRATDPHLRRHIDGTLETVQDVNEERPYHELGINLPDLESQTASMVVKDHVRLVGPIIFAAMFDELKAFQALDYLIGMSQRGQLTLSRGKAGTLLYNYWRNAPNLMSEPERQTFYAMILGSTVGSPDAAGNPDFQDLWTRFVSSACSLVRENRVDQLIRSSLPVAINQQQVKKAARDLVANMSLHGYGMAYYAAIDLQKQINQMIELFSDPEIRAALGGAPDMWGAIDQVAQVELGGARNSSKYRTLATCGAIITTWLADNLGRLTDPTMPIIDLREVENPPARPSGQSATSNPTDYDLVNACELWVADSAFSEDRIEQMSQPRESPQQTSRPIQIPSIARDLLEGTGLGLGMGVSNGRANGHGHAPAYPGY